MKVRRTIDSLHSQYEDGKTTFGVVISTEADSDDGELNEAFEAWSSGDDVTMEFRFSIRDCIDDMIDWHRLLDAEVPTISEQDRPEFDAVRAELVAMVERIDALRYRP